MASTPDSKGAPLKNRRSLGRRSIGLNSTPAYPLAFDGESENEEDERVARRKDALLHKSLTETSITGETPIFKDAYIEEQYNLYSHLHTENKINPRNAWSIKIIDMLAHLCRSKDSNNFQVAYTSIDIGAKVYGLRVDNVHSEVMKVAKNIARVTNEDSPDIDDSSNVGDNTVSGNTKIVRRKRRTKTKMIHDNPKALLGKIPKLPPTDFTARLDMEVGSMSSFLCRFLKEDASGCFYNILDKTKKVFEDVDPLVIADVKVPIRGLSLDPNLKVTLVLTHFSIGEEGGTSKGLAQTTQAVFDEDGIPLHELDGSIPDVLNNVEADDYDTDHDDNVGLADTKHTVHYDFRDVNHTMAFGPSEYGFNGMDGERGKFINHIWAGPSHWKLKGIQREKEVFSGRLKDKPAKKKYVRKVPKKMDFSQEVELDLSNKMSFRGRKTSKYDRITCPVQKISQDNIAKRVRELIMKPGSFLVEKNNDNIQCEVGSYKYGNLNDSNYCHEDEEDNNDGLPMEDHEQQNSLDLVEMPEKVSIANLAYSTKAKHMNIKKLKNSIWECLSHTQMEEKVAFSEIYSKVLNSSTADLKKNLSPHVAFVAALHICNEKSIYLKSEGLHNLYFCTEK